MPHRDAELTQQLDEFIEAGIRSGRFVDANEMVLAGLRLLERRDAEDQAKLEWLRGAVQRGWMSWTVAKD